MSEWRNWSGKQGGRTRSVHFARSEADICAVVAAATAQEQKLRVAGAGHSHSPLVPNPDVVLDLSGYAGVVAADASAQTARIRAGTRIYTLGRPLHDAGVALANQGDIDRQSIAGAVATGTHGTGRRLQNLSSAVSRLRVVAADGSVVECANDAHAELFEVARLGLGAVGVALEVTLNVVPAYRLAERGWEEAWPALAARLNGLIDAHRNFEFFWYPESDRCIAKTLDVTEAEPAYPLGAEGERVAWSYEVLPNHRPHRHTEMEYSIAAEDGPECFGAIRHLLQTRFEDVRWPVEYRTVAADDLWLSMAHGRETVTISVHQDVREDEEPYFRACEAIFRRYAGRPHWGKVHYLQADDFERLYPRWRDWWRVRDSFDPAGTFVNAHLEALRPGGVR